MWRPSEYTQDINTKVYEYLSECNDIFEDYIKSESEWARASSWTREQKIKVKLPTIEWLALYLWVNPSTIYEWRKHEEFSESLDKLLAEQKEKLVMMSLWGYYNPTIAKLMLSHNHWMKETTVQENTGKDWWPIEQIVSYAIPDNQR